MAAKPIETKPAPKPAPKPVATPAPKPAAKGEATMKPDTKPDTKPELGLCHALLGLIGADGTELTGPELAVDCDDAVVFRPGADATPDSLLLHLRSRAVTLRVTGLEDRPRVSFLRGFSAPVRVNYPRDA